MTTATQTGAEFLPPVRTRMTSEETFTWSIQAVDAPVTTYSQTPEQSIWRGVSSLSRDVDEHTGGAQSLSW